VLYPASVTDDRRKLLEFIKQHCLQRGEFKLASGGVSDHFIDLKKASLTSTAGPSIGRLLCSLSVDLVYNAVGGLQTGAIPIAAAIVHQTPRWIEGFFVREATKDHGTERLIEGRLLPWMRVLIVDDVISTGGSALKAIEAVREHGCTVEGVLTVVDRGMGAAANFAANDIRCYRPLFDIREVLA
jgi:orotate phosphoribosyltransferase